MSDGRRTHGRRATPELSELALALALLFVAPAGAAAARLEVRGGPLTREQVQSLMGTALRAPADSAALTAGLAALVARLQESGHLGATATATWSVPGERLVLEIAEGPLTRLGAFAVNAPTRQDSIELARPLGLARGEPAAPRRIASAMSRAVRQAVASGHPYASLGVARWTTEGDSLALGFSGSLGPLVTISAVRIDGLEVTRLALAEKSMGRLVGLPYNPASAAAARDRLAQLGLFRRITFEGLEGETDWSRARLLYRVEEPRYNQFEGAVGVQGDAGAVGLARLSLGNLLGTGRSMALAWESRGHGVIELDARYAEPLLLGAPLRLELALRQQVQDTLFVRTRWGARGLWALSGRERIEAGYEAERVVQEHGELEEAALQNTVFALERDARDEPLATRRGSLVRVQATQIFERDRLRPSGQRSSRASALEVRTEWHRPLSGNSGLALEVSGAGRFSSRRVLSLFERFPLGGAATLRGFDEEAFRVDRYGLSRLEWRWFLGGSGTRAALFWDHAWTGTRLPNLVSGDRFESLQHDGFGAGLRLDSAAGLVGVDYGLEAGRPPIEGKIHLRLISTF